jgi:hypothetical protein
MGRSPVSTLLVSLLVLSPGVGSILGLAEGEAGWQPDWLTVGTYAVYRAGCIKGGCDWPVNPLFLNGSRLGDEDSDVVATELTLRWEVEAMEGGLARLNVTMYYAVQRVIFANFQPVGYEHLRDVRHQTFVTLVLESRDLVDATGVVWGKWILWINPGLETFNETGIAVLNWIEGTPVLWKIRPPQSVDVWGIQTEVGTFHSWITGTNYIHCPEVQDFGERFRCNSERNSYAQFWNGTGPRGSLFLQPAYHVATGMLLRSPTYIDDVLTQRFGVVGGISELALYETNAPLFRAVRSFDPSSLFLSGSLLLSGSWLAVAVLWFARRAVVSTDDPQVSHRNTAPRTNRRRRRR